VVTFFLLLLFAWKKYGFKYVWPKLLLCTSIGVLSLMFVYMIVNFPYPRISGSTGLIMSRLQNASGEAAGSSRLNQLKPLGQAISKSPLIGSGFATTVTYLSNDPRIVAASVNQSGWYTTYSFEWGYLDIWLKIGLFGLGIYAWFISMLILKAYKNNQLFSYTLIFGVISIIIANVTTPYLNHPLGMGLLFILLVGNNNMYETV
jgi:O-antigen ligase